MIGLPCNVARTYITHALAGSVPPAMPGMERRLSLPIQTAMQYSGVNLTNQAPQ